MTSSLIDELDPDIAAYVALLKAGTVPLDDSDMAGVRAATRALRLSWPRGPAMHLTRDGEFEGHRMRMHRPGAAERLPAIIFFHGGGWTLMDIDTHDAMMRGLAAASGAAVLAVDYPLAPEHPFPAGLEICRRFSEHVAAEADTFGLVPGAFALAGDSAGANLSVAVALSLRAAGSPMPRAMALLYGAYDTDLERESWRLFGNGDLPFSRERMEYFLRAYAPDADALSDPLFAPMHADVRGLPPAFLAVGSHDGLRDDSVAMAAHLREGGVNATLEVYPGAVHGFAEAATASGAALAKRMLADCGAFLKDALRA